jgi:hypothetical protein
MRADPLVRAVKDNNGANLEGSAMQRRGKIALAVALVLNSSSLAHALTPFDTISDWACASSPDRLNVADTLTLVAGRGQLEMGPAFFMQCLQDAVQTPLLRASKKINEVATGCILMKSITFSQSG